MDHGLAQLDLLVGMLDEIGLVDDIDRIAGFGDAPEHPVDAQAQLPLAVAGLSEQQQIGFAQIDMGALGVAGVVAQERRHGHAPPLGVLEIELGRGGHTARVRALAGIRGGVGIPAAFDAQAAGERAVDDLRAGVCGREQDRQRDPDRAESRRPGERGAAAHQRTRLNPVLVKSRSSRSVRNW